MLVGLIISLFFLIFPAKIGAIDNFNLDNTINYNIDLTGKTKVNQELILSNNISQIYPTEYVIYLSGSDISNLTASDALGNIVKSIEQETDQTKVTLKFNVQNVGQGKTTPIIINYTADKIVEHKGNVWEINLPEYKNLGENDQLDITLTVPTKFGKLAFSSANSTDTSSFQNTFQIHLNRSHVENKKNLFIFGDYQLFDFELKYHLKNDSVEETTTQIPLPPNFDSQKIVFKKIDPPPQKIDIDKDGNWLAQYLIPANKEINVLVLGQAKIIGSSYSQPQTEIDVSTLTKTQNFWPVDDSNITQIAANLSNQKDIYNYVVKTLSYNFDGISTATRVGALEALLNPDKALCTEFTDLFVTLARAKGIPAREIEGFAYTNNPKLKPTNITADILHAWPQYYDSSKQLWISIDPTWGKTTGGIDYFDDLDLNHLIFVIHGFDSQFPPPPGSVRVTFANTEILPEITKPLLSIENNNLIVQNSNSNPLFQTNISIPLLNYKNTINFIGPYTKINLPLPKINYFEFINPKYKKITIYLENNHLPQKITYEKNYLPYYKNIIILTIGAIFILSICGIILTRHEKIS